MHKILLSGGKPSKLEKINPHGHDTRVDRQVTITLEEPEAGTTVLHLRQTGIPAVDKFGHETRDADRAAEEGWRLQILQRIRATFGYGM